MATNYEQSIKKVLENISPEHTLTVNAVKKINKLLDTFLTYVSWKLISYDNSITDINIDWVLYSLLLIATGVDEPVLGIQALEEGRKAAIRSVPASPTDVEEQIIRLLERYYKVDEPMKNSVKKLTQMKKTKADTSFVSGLIFSASTVAKNMEKTMKKSQKSKNATVPKVSRKASVYLAAVLEYLTEVIVEQAINASRNKSKINDVHIYVAIALDDELKELCDNIRFKYSFGIFEHDIDRYLKSHGNGIPKDKLINQL